MLGLALAERGERTAGKESHPNLDLVAAQTRTFAKPHGTKYFKWTCFLCVNYTLVKFEEEERRGLFLSGLHF